MSANEKGDAVEVEQLIEKVPEPTLPTVNPEAQTSKPAPAFTVPPAAYVV